MNEVEDSLGVAIEVVSVGDTPTTMPLAAAVSAAQRGGHELCPPRRRANLRVCGAHANGYEVFVRDAGPGFDPEAVPDRPAGHPQLDHWARATCRRRRRRYARRVGESTEVTITVPREEQR